MSFFQGSHRLAIEGGTFSSVGRDQVNITQCSHHREGRKRTILDEYQEIPMGKVYLKLKLAETNVKIEYKKEWRNVDARRTIHTARIRGEDKDEEFLHIQYSGRDAAKACKLDFDAFSAVKDTDSLQLFGYSNINAMPALVFYNGESNLWSYIRYLVSSPSVTALVPVTHIWERNNFSPMLYTYFSYQAVAVQGLDYTILSQELWFEPETGFLRKGPFVRDSSNINYDLVDLSTILPDQGLRPSLTLQTCSETRVLFEYLNGTLSISDIIRGIRWSTKAVLDYPNDEDAKSILSSLPGTVYHRASLVFVARYPEDREICYYEFLERVSIIPDALQGTAFSMDDGSMRFTLKPLDMGDLESFKLCYDLRPWELWTDFAYSWLSQAHGIFSQLRVEEDEWGQYCIMTNFWLNFEPVKEHGASHTCMGLPEGTLIYLFIRPIPRPCDDEDRWDSWLREVKYYWSFDSCGAEEMSEHERLNLGLPAFTTKIELCQYWWDRDAYNVIEMIHRSREFEPTSMEFATSVGYSIMEVAGRKPRFEELNDDDGTGEAMDIDGLTSTFSAFNVDSDGMIVNEMTIPCNEPRCDDAMEID